MAISGRQAAASCSIWMDVVTAGRNEQCKALILAISTGTTWRVRKAMRAQVHMCIIV